MAKLKGIASARLGPIPASRFGPAPFVNEADRSRYRREVQPWRKWYDTTEWRGMARACKIAANFTCQWPGCGRVCGKGEAIADHIKPHRGDRAMFFDPKNLQCLCKACHDSKKQAEERAAGW
jgi:5-methylcytosine-specific restriction endonuclease McrA